jgi:hypothetical protein
MKIAVLTGLRNIPDPAGSLSRRALAKLACAAGVGYFARSGKAAETRRVLTLFDGRTLDGWIQIENNAISLSSGSIKDPAAFIQQLMHGSDAMSAFLRSRLESSLKTDLAAYSSANTNAKAVLSALVKSLNQILAGPSIYDQVQLRDLPLRAETSRLLQQNPQGQPSARLNKLLLEDAYPDALEKASPTGWIVKDGAMASIGAGRGVIYTANDYSRYRLMFTMRHVSGNPDHQACVLIFCRRPEAGENALDALGGIQFQVPNGGHWDYRPGMNNSGGEEFASITKAHFDVHQWSRVEIVANASKGVARMAVAQPPGSKAVEVLRFQDAAAGKIGPIAWQMHNAGLFDEYKDVTIEVDPEEDDLTSIR